MSQFFQIAADAPLEIRTTGRNTQLIVSDSKGKQLVLCRQPPETKDLVPALKKVLEHYRVFNPNVNLVEFLEEFIIP